MNPRRTSPPEAVSPGSDQGQWTGAAGAPTAEPAPDGDELAGVIRDALQSDSTTASLPIAVEVWDRVIHLRGVVPSPREQEAVGIVVARVKGVGVVADDLDIWNPSSSTLA